MNTTTLSPQTSVQSGVALSSRAFRSKGAIVNFTSHATSKSELIVLARTGVHLCKGLTAFMCQNYLAWLKDLSSPDMLSLTGSLPVARALLASLNSPALNLVSPFSCCCCWVKSFTAG